jgi:hypothetical protein
VRARCDGAFLQMRRLLTRFATPAACQMCRQSREIDLKSA